LGTKNIIMENVENNANSFYQSSNKLSTKEKVFIFGILIGSNIIIIYLLTLIIINNIK
jgi:hypothetical protein